MKIKTTLFWLCLIFVCTSQRCNRGSNDLLSRMYNRSYKSTYPLTTQKDPVFSPLLGSWMVGSERVLVVTKSDETTLQLNFISNDLDESDNIYYGYISNIGKKKYLNMLAYQNNYMFFKVNYQEATGLKLDMITNDVYSHLASGTLHDYLQKNPNTSDTTDIWFPVSMQKMTDKEREQYIMARYRSQIRYISDYDIYSTKFPKDPDLDSIKSVALTRSLYASGSVNELMAYTVRFPEAEKQAKAIAKEKCYTTNWCLDYINYFPKDPAKDSIIDVSFKKADDYKDYAKLLDRFPDDPRTATYAYKIAVAEAEKLSSSSSYSTYYQDEMEKRYYDKPEIINYINTIRMMNNVVLEKESFHEFSYVLTEKGKAKTNEFIQLVKMLNASQKNVTDVWIVVNADSAYAIEKHELLNFKLCVNRCITLKKYINTTYPELNVHCVPYGKKNEYRYTKNLSEKAKFYLSGESISEQKRDFNNKCFSLQQTQVIPNAQKEMMNTDYVREEELEEYILSQLPAQISAWQKNLPYTKLIPPNFWDEKYKPSQPYYNAIKEKIMLKAAEKGIDVKKLQHFVSAEI